MFSGDPGGDKHVRFMTTLKRVLSNRAVRAVLVLYLSWASYRIVDTLWPWAVWPITVTLIVGTVSGMLVQRRRTPAP